MTSYYHAGMEHIRAQSARYGSAPTRERDSDQLSPIARAAWYVEDAFSGNFEEDMDSRTNAQRDAYVRYESLVHPERLVCVVALALVSLIEVPLWCLQGRNNLFWVGGSEVCRKHDLYLSGIEYVPYIATLLVEACALGYLATLCGLEVGFGRPRDIKLQTRLLTTGLAAFDLVIFALRLALDYPPSFRLGPYLRVILLAANTKEVWAAGRACLAMIPSFLDVSLLLTLCILFFGWLAAITLDDVETVKDGLPVNEGFTSLGEGIYTMFFVSTTANFPDQMLASYASSRSFGLFFAFYVLLACFIFLNLILAVVYNERRAAWKSGRSRSGRGHGVGVAPDAIDAIQPRTPSTRHRHAGTRPRSRMKLEGRTKEGSRASRRPSPYSLKMIASRVRPSRTL